VRARSARPSNPWLVLSSPTEAREIPRDLAGMRVALLLVALSPSRESPQGGVMRGVGSPRTVSLQGWDFLGRPERRHCAVRGCGKATSDRKLYCIDHLDRQPYIRRLRALLTRREREEAAAHERRWRDLDPRGSLARDVLDQLEIAGSQMTIGRLGRAVHLSPTGVASCIRALVAAGAVVSRPVTARNGRRYAVVSLCA
jgi:hypothetical protein